MSSIPTIEDIIDVLYSEALLDDEPTSDKEFKSKAKALAAIDSIVAEVIGQDDDMTLSINPASDEDLLITLGENANNRLRAEQRKRYEQLRKGK